MCQAHWRQNRQHGISQSSSSRPTQSKPASFPDLARPGGNITGISLMSAASNAKNIELFRDMLPSVRRVGVLGNTKDSVFAKAMLDEVLRAGGPTGTEIQPVMRIREPDEAESAFVAMVRERVDAVVIQGSLAIKSVTDLAIKYRLRTA